jgi:hypothetical protein
MRHRVSRFLKQAALTGFAAAVILPAAAQTAPPLRVSIDLGSYRGYWRLETHAGTEVAHDECFIQRVCVETFKALPPGDYALVLSQQPQSAAVRFTARAGQLVVTSGNTYASADAMTLRLKGFMPTAFKLSGYRGAWSLELWNGAEAAGFFRRDGGEQVIDLLPETTYGLRIGPHLAERFQIDREGRMVLIDDSGAVRAVAGPPNRLDFQTLDTVIYPVPATDPGLWAIEGLPPADGRMGYNGPRILQLVQGTRYRVYDPKAPADAQPKAGAGTLITGKACNMTVQKLPLPRAVVHAVPLPMSCS